MTEFAVSPEAARIASVSEETLSERGLLTGPEVIYITTDDVAWSTGGSGAAVFGDNFEPPVSSIGRHPADPADGQSAVPFPVDAWNPARDHEE